MAATVSGRHRHRLGAVPERDQGSGNLRAFREGRAAARLPPRQGTRLWRDDHRDAAEGRDARRDGPQPADLLSTVTRDPFHNRGRITDLMSSGKLFEDVGLPIPRPRRIAS